MIDSMITIYGCGWCGDCAWVRQYFDKNHIPYNWVDIENDESGEEFVLATNNGLRSVPTIVFNDGSILVEPSIGELQTKLGTRLPAN
jgi:glutaredoxin-like protein